MSRPKLSYLEKELRLNNDGSVVLTSNSFATRLISINLNIINEVLRDVNSPLRIITKVFLSLATFVISRTTYGIFFA
jgi:hypothetical protein